jgi:hypothetical protein
MRSRNWIVASVLIAAVIAAATLAGRSKPRGPRPHVAFGAQVQPPGASGALLAYTNGWVATAGTRTVAVYAGSQAQDHGNGLLVIVRETHGAPRQKDIVLEGSGSLTLLRPARPVTESAAFGATVHFVTANGATGTLDLATDRYLLSR